MKTPTVVVKTIVYISATIIVYWLNVWCIVSVMEVVVQMRELDLEEMDETVETISSILTASQNFMRQQQVRS